jgi:hypothetical protein
MPPHTSAVTGAEAAPAPVSAVLVAAAPVVVTAPMLLDRSGRVNEGGRHECLPRRSPEARRPRRAHFLAPVRPGDEITGSVEVVEARDDKPITTLRTSVTRGDGTVVLDGTAVCYTMSLE